MHDVNKLKELCWEVWVASVWPATHSVWTVESL